MVPKAKETNRSVIMRRVLAFLLVLSMVIPAQLSRNVFAEGETPSIDLVYDLGKVNNSEEGAQKSFTVTAKVKNAQEIPVMGVSLSYDKDSLIATSTGSDVATYSGDVYSSGIWKSTDATAVDSENDKITYEAYVDTNCATKELGEDKYSITSTNTTNRLFNSTADGYDFVTFNFTIKDGVEDIATALKSVQLNEDYYTDGILYADGATAAEAGYSVNEQEILTLTLSGLYVADGDYTGKETVYITNETTLEEAIGSKDYGIKEGSKFVGWTDSESGTDALAKDATFTIDTNLYTLWDACMMFDLAFEGAGTIEPIVINSAKTYKDHLISAGFTDSEGSYSDPKRDHYTFSAWTNNNTVVLEDIPSDENPITLTATWTPVNYTINYNLGEGVTNGEGNPATFNIETEDVELKYATKTGHTFTGWYTEANGSGTKIESITKDNLANLLKDSTEGTTKEIVLYPSFDINKYNVTEPADSEGKYTISEFTIQGSEYSEGKVAYAEAANISFAIELDESCNESTPACQIKMGESTIDMTLNNEEGVLTFTTTEAVEINGDISFTIGNVETNKYSVALPSGVTGATVAAAKDYDTNAVEHGKDFKFTVTLDEAYSKAEPVVKNGENALTGEKGEDGVWTYTIENVTGDIADGAITIESLSMNTYSITLAGANEDIYFVTDLEAGTKLEIEDRTITHNSEYVFNVKYTNTDNKYTGYKVKVNGQYINEGEDTEGTVFTDNKTFENQVITSDTTIKIEPQYNCGIRVVFRAAGEGVTEESYLIQAQVDNSILTKLEDTGYAAKLNEFLGKYSWLSDSVSYKLGDVAVDETTTVTENTVVKIKAQFTRSKYVIKYTGATFKEGTTDTQDVSVEAGNADITLLARTTIDPTENIANDLMFAGWQYKDADAPTNTEALSEIDLFTAGPEFTAKWVGLGDFNGDNALDLEDLNNLLTNYGKTEDSIYDIDCNGTVNGLDLALLLSHYGTTYTKE